MTEVMPEGQKYGNFVCSRTVANQTRAQLFQSTASACHHSDLLKPLRALKAKQNATMKQIST
jgi:hypothetical protein